ncbi:hypothetical protein SAMN05216593_105202 [Pseudomonas asturiensis]|uniref:Transposase n=1 Tax=Pseudomonas asturiensis TaxID=1190415 RepID=A0A1M7N5L1_9PSED|nr:hypothetical protein SAMN05216593_105202 [Pseudomonas asturiensis]
MLMIFAGPLISQGISLAHGKSQPMEMAGMECHDMPGMSQMSHHRRSIVSMMQEGGEKIVRFKVRGLMRELELVSKQPGSHAYKQATFERPDIPNILNRAFDVPTPNQVWCGDITYIWAQGKWHYLAVVMNLYARRVMG